jgi:hypothetical protein
MGFNIVIEKHSWEIRLTKEKEIMSSRNMPPRVDEIEKSRVKSIENRVWDCEFLGHVSNPGIFLWDWGGRSLSGNGKRKTTCDGYQGFYWGKER